MMKKILVTGSEGFLGTHLLEKLENRTNTDIWTLDINGQGKQHFNQSVETFDQFDDFDVIYHLAALSSPSACKDNLEPAWRINVEATKNLVSQLQPSQKITFSSSAYVYEKEQETPRSEDDPLRPDNFYGVTKQVSEQLIRYYASQQGFDYTILRIFNVYGPGQSEGFLVPDVIKKADEQDEIAVKGGENRISPMYVEDATDVLTSNVGNGIYNVCHECVTVQTVYEAIAGLNGVDLKTSDFSNNPVHLCGDGSKISEEKQNWTSLEDGIRQTIAEM